MGHHRRKKIMTYLVWFVVFALILTACQKHAKESIDKTIENLKNKYNKVNPALPLPSVMSPIGYFPQARKIFNEIEQSAARNNANNPLQMYTLTNLQLVGVVQENGSTYAYIATPNNLVYRADMNTILGDRNGHIIEFGEKFIKVQEDARGNATAPAIITLNLKGRK